MINVNLSRYLNYTDFYFSAQFHLLKNLPHESEVLDIFAYNLLVLLVAFICTVYGILVLLVVFET